MGNALTQESVIIIAEESLLRVRETLIYSDKERVLLLLTDLPPLCVALEGL